MAEEKTSNKSEQEEKEPEVEEKIIRRKVEEIRPIDPSPEIHDPEPPKLSISGVLNIVKKKGLLGALTDDAWGPHVHILMLLIVIILVAISVAIISI